MGRQRQLMVNDNAKVVSGVRDGEAHTKHQDVAAVDLVYCSDMVLCPPWRLS